MKALTALLALASTAGIGYLVYKKITETKEVEAAYTEYKEKEEPHKEGKVRRASMYAVGAIKTTADKISEGIQQVKSEDMVKKGEEQVEKIKANSAAIKERIKEKSETVKEGLKDSTGNIKEDLKDASGNIKDEIKDTAVSIKDELSEIKDLVTSINGTPSSSDNYNQDDQDDQNDEIGFDELPTFEGIPEAEEIDDDKLFEEEETVDQL